MQIDDGDVKFWGLLVGWGLSIAAFVFGGGRRYEKIATAVDDHEKRLEVIESDYITGKEHDKMQATCRQHITDTLLLALEKRDREFDKKFSTICQGLTEIKTEIKGKLQ
jgi:hypothetical protein